MTSPFTITQGNCTKFLPQLEDGSIDLVLTDPPYNLGEFSKSRNAGMHRLRPNNFVTAGWDNEDYDSWMELMDKVFTQLGA